MVRHTLKTLQHLQHLLPDFYSVSECWQRGPNPPILWRPPYIPTPLPLFNPVTTNPHPHCSFCCLVSLTEWVIMPHLICYFTYWYYGSILVKPCYLSTRRTLTCVLCNKASSLLWSHTWFFASTLIWYHTHKHTHTKTHWTLMGQ